MTMLGSHVAWWNESERRGSRLDRGRTHKWKWNQDRKMRACNPVFVGRYENGILSWFPAVQGPGNILTITGTEAFHAGDVIAMRRNPGPGPVWMQSQDHKEWLELGAIPYMQSDTVDDGKDMGIERK